MNNAITQDVVVRLMIQSSGAGGAASQHNAELNRITADTKRSLSSVETSAKSTAGSISSATADITAAFGRVKGQVAQLNEKMQALRVEQAAQVKLSQFELAVINDLTAHQKEHIAAEALLVESKKAVATVTSQTSAITVKSAQVEAEEAKKTAGSVERLVESYLGLRSGSIAAVGGIGLVSAALGAFVASALIAVAVIGSLVAIGVKATDAFASYGEEVIKAQIQTDLSAEAIATLTVISKESNTTLNALALTASRLEVNISKGITRPTSEAGRALKFLSLDTKQLIQDAPDVQLQKVTKALLSVDNANKQNRASAALAGLSFNELKPALVDIGSKWDEARAKADLFGLSLTKSQLEAARQYNEIISDIGLATQGFLVQAGSRFVPDLLSLFSEVESALFSNRAAWVGWAQFIGDRIDNFVNGVRIALVALKADLAGLATFLATGNIATSIDVANAVGTQGSRDVIRSTGTARATQAAFDATSGVKLARNAGADYPTRGGGGSHHKELTELQRLQRELTRTEAQISSLRDSTSREFDLKFRLEDAQRLRSDLEEILKLRHEMGLPLRVALPDDNKSARDFLRFTKLQKTVYDDVTRAVNAQGEAEAKLAALRVSSTLPVVDAITRADTKYLEGVIERKNAEQELTAQIIADSRLRADAERDYAGQAVKAYQTVRLQQGRTLDEMRAQRLQDQAFVLALSGGESSLSAAARQRVGSLDRREPPSELARVAQLAASLDANVARIAVKLVGSAAPSTAATGTRNDNASTSALGALLNPDVGSRVVRPALGPHEEGIVSLADDTQALAQSERDYATEVVKTETAVQSLTVREAALAIARETASGERAAQERSVVQELLTNNERLAYGLISLDSDVALMRSTKAVARMHDDRATVLSIQSLEDDLFDVENNNEDALARMRNNATQDRLSSHLALKQGIVSLEEEIAHAGEDSADRMRAAHLSAVRDLQRAHEDAAASIIKSQVTLSQQTVYHADIADSKVLEFLAHQKSITDTLADAKIGVIQTTFDLIDKGLDRTIGKLPVIGHLIASIISDLLKPQLTSFFARLFGLPTTSGGRSSGGAVGSLLSLATPFIPQFAHAGAVGPGGAILSGAQASTGFVQSLAQRAAVNPFSFAPSSHGAPGFLPTLGQQAASQQQAITLATAVSHASGASGAAGAARTGSAASAGASGLAGILPLLGLSAGAQLGGSFFRNSRAASTIGTVAGGALGLSAGLAGFFALGGTVGAGALGTAAGLIAGALPFLAPIAIAALVGAYFLNRNAKRRQEEVQRTQILTKSRSDIDALIAQVRSGRLDGTTAIAQALAIRQQYLSDVSQLKDSKTRNIALATVRELDAKIAILRTESARADRAADVQRFLTPTFKMGGDVVAHYNNGGGYRTSYGGRSDVDYIPAMLANDETVITPQTRAALGGDRRMRQVNVRGYNDGGSARAYRPSSAQVSAQPELKVLLLMVPDEKTADAWVQASGSEVVAKKVRAHVKKTKQSGLAGDIFDLFVQQ